MHMHGIPLNVSAANFDSAELEQKNAARRSLETRKRLLRAGQALAADAEPDDTESLLVSHWLGAAPHPGKQDEPTPPGDEYQSSSWDAGTDLKP
jgi:hypothetical protein